MLDAIKRFFQAEIETSAEAAAADRIGLATCALLLEVAHADDDFTDVERELVATLVRGRFGLDAADADELIGLAERERLESADLYQFTRLVREQLPRADRLAIVEALWRVVYSDGVLEAHEDAMMHKLARLLELDHAELIALKLRVKNGDA